MCPAKMKKQLPCEFRDPLGALAQLTGGFVPFTSDGWSQKNEGKYIYQNPFFLGGGRKIRQEEYHVMWKWFYTTCF